MATRLRHIIGTSLMVAGCFLSAGCEKQETIQVYQVPKENAGPAGFVAPSHWQEAAANSVSVANFNLATPEGLRANISIAPLPALANRETEIINMWRQQMGMGDISREEAGKLLSEVEVAGTKGKLFELTSPATASEASQQIITVMQHDDERSWFYKISGDASLVAREKANFLAFIKTVKLDVLANARRTAAPPQAHQHAEAEPAAAPDEFKWKVPEAWQQQAPGSMQVAKFKVPPQNDATAEVTVSVFPSDTGGDLANINRWRGQIKLPPVDDAGLAKIVKPLDSSLPGSLLVDMENEGDRMIGAIVKRGGQWYFYKLRGASAVVGSQKDAFVSFARSEP